MTRDEFWEHIRESRRNDTEEHAERLAVRLARLPVAEILSFGQWWHVAEAESYTWDLWGAAYLINGGCSDDGFEYFRNWLILQGRETFEAALQDPDTLKKVLRGAAEVETECHPAYDAYCAVTGQADYAEALHRQYPDLPKYPALKKSWDFDDDEALRQRYPQLVAEYLGGG